VSSAHHIAVLPRGGIGREVMEAAGALLGALEPGIGVQFRMEWLPAGA